MKLSPLNLHGIKHSFPFYGVPTPPAGAAPREKRRADEVVMWRCPDCHQLHDDEDDAIDCCDVEPEAEALEGPKCPVCGERHIEHRDAADCCLWKDIPALERWRIADAVEAGSDWKTELGVK